MECQLEDSPTNREKERNDGIWDAQGKVKPERADAQGEYSGLKNGNRPEGRYPECQDGKSKNRREDEMHAHDTPVYGAVSGTMRLWDYCGLAVELWNVPAAAKPPTVPPTTTPDDRHRGSGGESDRRASGRSTSSTGGASSTSGASRPGSTGGAGSTSGASRGSSRRQRPAAQNAGLHHRDHFGSGGNGSGVGNEGLGHLAPLADELREILVFTLICAITLVVSSFIKRCLPSC